MERVAQPQALRRCRAGARRWLGGVQRSRFDARHDGAPTIHARCRPLDLLAVERFLQGRLDGGVHGLSEVSGAPGRAYAFRASDRAYIARFSAYGEDFEKDRLAAACSSQLGARGLPVPQVTETGEALGCFYAISERAFGEYLEELDERQTGGALPSLFEALDAARGVDVASSTGFGVWMPMATRLMRPGRPRCSTLRRTDLAAEYMGGGDGSKTRQPAPRSSTRRSST